MVQAKESPKHKVSIEESTTPVETKIPSPKETKINHNHPIWVNDPAKAELFNYLLNHDFQEEVDLYYLLNLEFELSPEEDALTPNISNVMKLLKIVFYRTGITTHNQRNGEKFLTRDINKKL